MFSKEVGAMSTFIEKNLYIIAGITIPILLFVFLSIAMVLIRNATEPPRYDFLYIEYKDSYPTVKVENGKLMMSYWASNPKPIQVQLFRYDVKTNASQALKLDFSAPTKNENNTISQEIYAFSGYTLNQETTSPDGYTFRLDYGVISEAKRQARYSITKNGKAVNIPSQKDYYVQFVGWIVPN